MRAFKIEKLQQPEYPSSVIVRIRGELDSSRINTIRDTFNEIIENDTVRYIIVDMSQVTLVSSACLGEFMGCKKRFEEKEGKLVFASLELELLEKLTLLGATKIFTFYKDIRSALNAYDWEFKGVSHTVAITVPTKTMYVPPLRRFCSRIARQKEYSPRDSFRIETIVDELCNNAIEHGVSNNDEGIHILMAVDKEKVELEVKGRSDPAKASTLKKLSDTLATGPKPDTCEKRGRGLTLIKMLSNEFDIEVSDNGTSVHVTRLREE